MAVASYSTLWPASPHADQERSTLILILICLPDWACAFVVVLGALGGVSVLLFHMVSNVEL